MHLHVDRKEAIWLLQAANLPDATQGLAVATQDQALRTRYYKHHARFASRCTSAYAVQPWMWAWSYWLIIRLQRHWSVILCHIAWLNSVGMASATGGRKLVFLVTQEDHDSVDYLESGSVVQPVVSLEIAHVQEIYSSDILFVDDSSDIF